MTKSYIINETSIFLIDLRKNISQIHNLLYNYSNQLSYGLSTWNKYTYTLIITQLIPFIIMFLILSCKIQLDRHKSIFHTLLKQANPIFYNKIVSFFTAVLLRLHLDYFRSKNFYFSEILFLNWSEYYSVSSYNLRSLTFFRNGIYIHSIRTSTIAIK